MSIMWNPSAPGSLERYRGCMAGGLLGDCVGFLFELPHQPSVEVSKILAKVGHYQKDGREMIYTDDTAMRLSIAYSLIARDGFDEKDVAKSFTERFFSDDLSGTRAYGNHVTNIFYEWSRTKYGGDVYEFSRKQFDGRGSYGNGAAMRTQCVPLFFYSDMEKMTEISKKIGQLTHNNPEGYNGGILISLAVHLALTLPNEEKLDPLDFIDKLLQLSEKYLVETAIPTHKSALRRAKNLLKMDNVPRSDVIEMLGHSIRSVESVTTAIYCALVGTKTLEGITTENPLEKTILYAVSLGGDCDTIATMAGAISGAFYGISSVREDWLKMCEAYEETDKLAEKLFQKRK